MLQIIITYINQKYQLGYKKRNNKNIPGRRNEDGSSAQVLTPSPSPFVPRRPPPVSLRRRPAIRQGNSGVKGKTLRRFSHFSKAPSADCLTGGREATSGEGEGDG